MPDTSRTKNDLLTNIFQDGQTAGAITPQDMRDLIVSLTPSSATARFSTPATFTITTPGEFVFPATGTSELIHATNDITMPSDGQVRYTGTANRHLSVVVSIEATVGGNNQDCQFQLTLNGNPIPGAISSRTWSTGSDTGHLTIISGLIVSQNDTISIQAANTTSSNDIIIQSGVIELHGHIF